ncbi:MAG: HNH endonuclease, partial [Candidatus Promineifilaceae bacterium]
MNYVPENHYRWQGGTSKENYGRYWPSITRYIRKRDHYTCQICGCKETGRAHDVHHIIPARTFNGNLKEAHKPSNLTTLCK